MNFPVSTAGLVLAPRGFGSMLSAFLCGRLLNRVGIRPMVILGFVIAAYVQYCMVYWDPDASHPRPSPSWASSRASASPSSPCRFPPSSSPLCRPICGPRAPACSTCCAPMGGAIGISVSGAMLERNSEINHANISAAVTPFNRALDQRRPAAFLEPAASRGGDGAGQRHQPARQHHRL